MSEKISATERIMNLISYLFKNSSRYVTRTDIFDEVEGYAGETVNDALLRLFERDKIKLKEIGITLKTISDHIGESSQAVYQIDIAESMIPPMNFTSEERLLLETLATTIPTDSAVGHHLRLALMKLRNDYMNDESEYDDDEDLLEEQLRNQPSLHTQKRETAHESPLIRELLDAIGLKKCVRFTYSRPGSEKKQTRDIAPYGLYFVNRFWYLIGFSFEREALRVFKLERISGRIKVLSKAFVEPDKEELEKVRRQLLQQEFGTINVKLVFKPEIAFLVEQEYGNIGEFSINSDGSAVLDLRNTTKSVLWRILSDYQELVRIDSPENVISDVKKELTQILAQYE